jgi:CRISPR system Cascade subunit CasE
MYLSKLLLNSRCRDARRDLASPYELHRTLARGFPTPSGTDYRAEHGVLFRLEPSAYGAAGAVVLVQSRTQPDWHQLPETYLLNGAEPAQTKPLPITFTNGQTLAFRLVANPTKKEKRDGQVQGRRVALPDYLGREADEFTDGESPTPARFWLDRKGQQHGFQVLYAQTEAFWLGSDRRSTTKKGIPFYGVRYDGLLQVTDPAALATALSQGIGPAKAFGFGLLSLARPR